MSKDIFIAEYDRIYSKLVDAGCPEDMAHEIASEKAYPAMQERYADMIDQDRQRKKDGRI